MTYEWPTLAVIGIAFLLAGIVKGVIGMGLPTVAIGVLSLAMPPAQAAALFIAPSLATNTWQSLAGPHLWGLLRRLWSFFLCGALGIWATGGVLTADSKGLATVALGLCLALYACLGLVAPQFRVSPRWEPWLSPVAGAASGLIAGATGVFVIPAVPYLQALDMDREDLIQSLGLSFLLSTIVLGLVLAQAGILAASAAGLSLLAILPAAVGMYMGQLVRNRVSPGAFRVCFYLGMLGLGLHLASRALF